MQTETESRSVMLKRAQELHQTADTLLRSIYEKRVAWSARQTATQEKMRCAFATVRDDPMANTAWHRLLNHLRPQTVRITLEPVLPYLGPQPGNTALDALLMLALRHEAWRHPPETWQPTTPDARAQIGALARHLLAHYSVPHFMDSAWFEGFTPDGEQHRDWFVHIGSGRNIRRAALPLRLTEKAAHYFLQAPDDGSIVAALRYGQTLALGGDPYLAQAIADSRLGSILPDEPFWASVIHFFVNNPGLDTASVGPIVDYIHHQKFGDQNPVAPPGHPAWNDAPEPDFTMKGRTLRALQKRVEEWHEILAKDSKRPRTSWEPSGIQPFYVEERDPFGITNAWVLLELCDSRALQEEGREMRHCVRTYADACLRGTTSIWSLRVRPANDARTRRLLTIEVNNTRRAIVQVRGRCNKTLGSFRSSPRMKLAGEILRRWAREQRLSVACSLG